TGPGWVSFTSAKHRKAGQNSVGVDTYASSLGQYTQMGMPNLQANGAIERVISQQAAMMGANDIFWISAVLFIVLIALIWLTRPAKSAGGAEAAAGAH
ncbi:MFS transporter, partial [Ralstonia solanacearum]|nr:MFS transporter [Ralstonia solanacearum]